MHALLDPTCSKACDIQYDEQFHRFLEENLLCGLVIDEESFRRYPCDMLFRGSNLGKFSISDSKEY